MQPLNAANIDRMVEILKNVPLFKSLSELEIEHLYMQGAEFLKTKPAEVIITEGAKEPYFYILLTGQAEIYKNNLPSHIIATLKPGNFLGENSYLNNSPRNANVRATQECVIMKMDAKVLHQMPLEIRDKIKDKFIEELIRRVTKMNAVQLELVARLQRTEQKLAAAEQRQRS